MQTTTLDWTAATKDLRAQLAEDYYEVALAEIEAERKGKDTTERQRNQARNRARGMVIATLYKMKEHNGVRNPLADDEVWGPKAKPEPKTAKSDPELEALVEWLSKQTWSEFATSLSDQYKTRGTLSPKQVASAKKMKATMDAKKKTEAPAPKASTLDLSDIPSGYYAVPEGKTRLKVRIAHGKPGSKWDGWVFVSDGAEYGQRTNYGSQRPGQASYVGKIQDELKAIVADPEAAQRAYGRLTGSCGMCGRLLEDEASIEAGIGPVCAQKW